MANKYKKGMIIPYGYGVNKHYLILIENLGKGMFTVRHTSDNELFYYSKNRGEYLNPNETVDLHLNTLKAMGPIQMPTTKQTLNILKYLT